MHDESRPGWNLAKIDLSPENWDSEKNGSRAAILAGHSIEVARQVHEIALTKSVQLKRPYWEVENTIVNMIEANRPKIQMPAIPLWNQNELRKTQATMREASGERTGRYVNRRHKKTKSNKNQWPKNYTPPKKKRK